jgi:glycosyltransferase involved in cell wall biosynthesis
LSGVVWDGRACQAGFKAHKERGIGRYALNLLKAAIPLLEPGRAKLLTQANLPDPEIAPHLPRIKSAYAPTWLPIGKRLISHHLLSRLALAPAWRAGDLVHFLCHLDAPAGIHPRTVLTVHDLIAQRMEGLYRQGKTGPRFRLERYLETRCLPQAARIITPSECTKNDLTQLYGIDPSVIRVVPEAADPDLTPVDDPRQIAATLARHGLAADQPFFLYLGGIDQRKDLGTLLKALAVLRDQDLPHALVLAGRIRQDKQYPDLMARIGDLGLDQAVIQLDYVPDADLPALFAACAAFVFPSLYEGFGLPPLEAMACGAPVVAVAAAAVPEVVGRAGVLVPPGDAAALAEALAAVARLPELAQDLRAKGLKRAAEFSWQRAARETLAVHAEVAGALHLD